MRFLFFASIIFLNLKAVAHTTDTTKWLRAFPITDYIVAANDSVSIVQIQMPDGMKLPEKTLGALYGIYLTTKEDAIEKGIGRCQLIKGDYYYFGITLKQKTKKAVAGDLIYTLMPSTPVHYGYIPKLAGHYTGLTTVQDSAFYNRYNVFTFWTADNENKAIEGMINDIQFTGTYFKENNPAADIKIKSGDNKDKSTFEVMISCNRQLLTDFFDYILARPRLYAGKEWKVAEIFATWVSEGAPTVVK